MLRILIGYKKDWLSLPLWERQYSPKRLNSSVQNHAGGITLCLYSELIISPITNVMKSIIKILTPLFVLSDSIFFFFGFTLLIAFRMIILQYIFLNQHFLYYFLSCLNSNTDLLYNNVHLLNMTELYP